MEDALFMVLIFGFYFLILLAIMYAGVLLANYFKLGHSFLWGLLCFLFGFFALIAILIIGLCKGANNEH